MLPSLLLLALLPGLALGVACTDDENSYSYGIYESAALTLGCASISTISDSGVHISWSCADTDCLPVLRQLEYQLPDCENQDGDNLKYNLQQNLYENGCGLCDNDQLDTIMGLYTAAAQSDACDEYSTVYTDYVYIYWPCSATACSAEVAGMVDELPSCIEDGENVQTYVESLSCYGDSTVDDETEAPSTDSTGTSAASETPEPVDTSSASSDSSTPSSDYTYAPTTSDGSTAASYSYDSCSTSEVADMASQYYDTATSSACDADSSVTVVGDRYFIYIFTLCSSDCASSLRNLDDELPDCYYDYEAINKKKELAEALTVCDSRRRLSVGRSLEQESSYDYISITVYAEGAPPGSATSAAGISSESGAIAAEGGGAPRSASLSMIAAAGSLVIGAVVLLRN